MPEGFFEQLSSLGIAGLLFVMWWYERQERARVGAGLEDAREQTARFAELGRQLLEVVRANTEAMTALRTELRAHRASESEWVARLTRQLQRVEQQVCRGERPEPCDPVVFDPRPKKGDES
jgi:hypothetical protein